MRSETIIPDALHLCPGCEDVAAGELYCERCVHLRQYYDNLLTRTGYRKPGELGVSGELAEVCEEAGTRVRRRATVRGILLGLFWETWALLMFLALRYIWMNGK